MSPGRPALPALPALIMGLAVLLGTAAATASPITASPASPASVSASSMPAPASEGAATTPVDLNRAGVDELCTLPGIGRKKAEAIIALRERRPFTRVSQLLQIKGIGHKTLLKLKPRVMVGAPPGTNGTAPAGEPPVSTPTQRVVTAARP